MRHSASRRLDGTRHQKQTTHQRMDVRTTKIETQREKERESRAPPHTDSIFVLTGDVTDVAGSGDAAGVRCDPWDGECEEGKDVCGPKMLVCLFFLKKGNKIKRIESMATCAVVFEIRGTLSKKRPMPTSPETCQGTNINRTRCGSGRFTSVGKCDAGRWRD